MSRVETAKSYLTKRREGASVFEWTLTLPFAMFIVGFIFYIMLLLFSWASYGAVASTVAKDMNIRSTGLSTSNDIMSNVGEVVINGQSAVGGSFNVTKSQFKIDDATSGNKVVNSYKNALMYAASQHANQFYFPYTRFNSMNASIRQIDSTNSYSTQLDTTSTLSNYIVKVDIDYDFAPVSLFGLADFGKINLHTSGYAVIT